MIGCSAERKRETQVSTAALGSCIIKSLQLGHMDPALPVALLTPHRNKAQNRTEGLYWDYKESLSLTDRFKIAEFAKDILAFHNTNGGLVVVGINNEYVARGLPHSAILDTVQLRDKIRLYVGSSVEIFQDSFEVHENRFVWLIFTKKFVGSPQCMVRQGPESKPGRPVFIKGDYFYREADQVKRCISDSDIERVFGGISTEHLNAYNYQVDVDYFRLLMPDYEHFVGREAEHGVGMTAGGPDLRPRQELFVDEDRRGRCDVADGRDAPDDEAGARAHEVGIGLVHGLSERLRDARRIDAPSAARHHEDRGVTRGRLEDERVRDLRDRAADEASRVRRGPCRLRELDDCVLAAERPQRVVDAPDRLVHLGITMRSKASAYA